MFLAQFQWYRKWRGGKWVRATGLFWGTNWYRVAVDSWHVDEEW
jgi:hypothetical protein